MVLAVVLSPVRLATRRLVAARAAASGPTACGGRIRSPGIRLVSPPEVGCVALLVRRVALFVLDAGSVATVAARARLVGLLLLLLTICVVAAAATASNLARAARKIVAVVGSLHFCF